MSSKCNKKKIQSPIKSNGKIHIHPVDKQQNWKGTCNVGQFLILWKSVWKKLSWNFYCNHIRTFGKKTDFTPERLLNQAWLARDKLWRQDVNAAIRETKNSYENRSFSCIVKSIYEQLFLYFYFLINPGWLFILLFVVYTSISSYKNAEFGLGKLIVSCVTHLCNAYNFKDYGI